MKATPDESLWKVRNFGKFIHQFQPETKTLIKKLERILIKLYRQNVSFLFDQTWLNERLLPKYTYFKIHDPAVHHNTDTLKYCCTLVKRQINDNKEKINCLDGLWKVRKCSGQFWQIYPPIPTWNQDTYQETWKDIDKIIWTKCLYYLIKHA